MKHTKVTNLIGIPATVWLAAVLIVGCDTFESDVAPPKATFTSQDLYVMANREAVIDLQALVSANFSGQLKVTAPPAYGKLYPIAEGLMKYTPSKGNTRLTDSFEFTLYTAGNSILTKDTVYIHIETDSTDLPCRIYPAPDYVTGFGSSASIAVNVLQNDMLCDHTVQTEIYKPTADFMPRHGRATISGSVITYTPNSSFAGIDTLMYKVSVPTNPSLTGYGFVYISRDSICTFSLKDDAQMIELMDYPEQISIGVLANDQLCDTLSAYAVSVIEQPRMGTVSFDGSAFVFIPGETFATGTDSFVYGVSRHGTQKTARVTLVITGKPACTFQALADSIFLNANAASTVYLDILANDQLCDSLRTLNITFAPRYGLASFDENQKKIRYERTTLLNDSLHYEICSKSLCSKATVYIRQ